jgi:hypothetical protein
MGLVSNERYSVQYRWPKIRQRLGWLAAMGRESGVVLDEKDTRKKSIEGGWSAEEWIENRSAEG